MIMAKNELAGSIPKEDFCHPPPHLERVSSDADGRLLGSDRRTGAPTPLPARRGSRVGVSRPSVGIDRRRLATCRGAGGQNQIGQKEEGRISNPRGYHIRVHLLVSEILRAVKAFGVVLWNERERERKRTYRNPKGCSG